MTTATVDPKTEVALTPTDDTEQRRKAALLRAVGLDRVSIEQRELALAIAKRYDLDLLLKHLVLIDGKPYVTRDALLWIAHRDGHLDGIEVTEPVIRDYQGTEYWYAEATVYRNDMSHPFKYGGRYPVRGQNAKFGPEMATKVAEAMSLRRAFNISAPTQDERWDVDQQVQDAGGSAAIADQAHAEAAKPVTPESGGASMPAPDLTQVTADVFEGEVKEVADEPPQAPEKPAETPPADTSTGEVKKGLERCPAMPADNALGMTQQCAREKDHGGAHKSREGSWPA